MVMPGHRKKCNLVIIIFYPITDAFFKKYKALPRHLRISGYATKSKSGEKSCSNAFDREKQNVSIVIASK
jgi:hypothetical protein